MTTAAALLDVTECLSEPADEVTREMPIYASPRFPTAASLGGAGRPEATERRRYYERYEASYPRIGDRVHITGLVAAPQHNGKTGRITSLLDNGRFCVEVDTCDSKLSVRGGCLESRTVLPLYPDAVHFLTCLQRPDRPEGEWTCGEFAPTGRWGTALAALHMCVFTKSRGGTDCYGVDFVHGFGDYVLLEIVERLSGTDSDRTGNSPLRDIAGVFHNWMRFGRRAVQRRSAALSDLLSGFSKLLAIFPAHSDPLERAAEVVNCNDERGKLLLCLEHLESGRDDPCLLGAVLATCHDMWMTEDASSCCSFVFSYIILRELAFAGRSELIERLLSKSIELEKRFLGAKRCLALVFEAIRQVRADMEHRWQQDTCWRESQLAFKREADVRSAASDEDSDEDSEEEEREDDGSCNESDSLDTL